MKIVACCKIVPNEEEIKVLPNREIELPGSGVGGTPWKIGQYDLNALECGKRLAAETGGTLTALSVGSHAALDAAKMRKDILSRGADNLKLVINDEFFHDSLSNAKALAAALGTMEYDLVLCGVGSADLYFQQTGVQLGTLLGLPTINNVSGIEPMEGGVIRVERALENETEILEVTLPAVLALSSEINTPSIPSMRDIMRAGRKPMEELSPAAYNESSTETLSELAPEGQSRRCQIIEGDGEEAVNALLQFLKKECL